MNECNEMFENDGVAKPSRPKLSNHRYCPKEKKQVVVPIQEIRKQIDNETGNSLFTVNGTLHAVDKSQNVTVISDAVQFFAWLHFIFCLDWKLNCLSKNEFFEHCKTHSPQYQSLSHHPHFPKIKNVRYLCEFPDPIPGPETPVLDAFVNFFSASTGVDKLLIIALILTLFWGGPPGQRPSFVITGKRGQGIGTGKTTLVKSLAELVGGQISKDFDESAKELKTRLLTPSLGFHKERVISIDNVKASVFSSQDLEALITISQISGHRMYKGNASIPNYFTYVMTMNDPNLSRDLASRSMVIELSTPAKNPNWLGEVEEFIEKNLMAMLAEINYLLTVKQPESFTAGEGTRWPLWEKEVLSKVPNPTHVRNLIVQRQNQYDEAKHRRDQFEDVLEELRKKYSLKVVNKSIVVIPVPEMISIYHEFCGEKAAMNNISTKIARLGVPSIYYLDRKGKTKYFLFSQNRTPITEVTAKKALKAFENGQFSA
ncbi:MAG: hypothetical protein J0M26_18030 [Planctomycetes bacterium]|nr:hypothetical protein [Planctomycetota bacterium]